MWFGAIELSCTIAGVIAGLLLFLRAKHGPRVPGVLECRKCAFEPHAGASRCPECGADLSQPRSLRPRRVRRVISLNMGRVLMAISLLALVGVMLQRTTRTNLAPYLPSWLLQRLVVRGEYPHSHYAMEELAARHTAGTLSAQDMSPFVAQIAAKLNDNTVQWRACWSDMSYLGRQAGLVSDADWLKLVDRVVEVKLELPGSVEPCEITSGIVGSMWVQPNMATPIFTPRERVSMQSIKLMIGDLECKSHFEDSSFLLMYGNERGVWGRFVIPPETPPGEAEVVAIVDVTHTSTTTGLPLTATRTIKKRVNVLPRDPAKSFRYTDPQIIQQVKNNIEVTHLLWDGTSVAVLGRCGSIPVELTCEVILAANADDPSGHASVGSLCFQASDETHIDYGYPYKRPMPAQIDVILRPSLEAWCPRKEFTHPWLGPDIVFRAVPVKDNRPTEAPNNR